MKNLLRKILPKTLLVLFVLQSASCSGYKSSPRIWIFNFSDNYIKNAGGSWNGNRVLTLDKITPGGAPSQNLILKHQSDFFGPVCIEWENAAGQKIVKEFDFKKEQLPPTKNHNFDHVFIFLTQDDLKLIARGQMEEESEELKNMWKQANKFSDDYQKICPKKYGCKLNNRAQDQSSKSSQDFIDSTTDSRGVQVIRISAPDINNPKISKSCSVKDLESYQLEIGLAEAKKYGVPFKEIPQNQRVSSKCLRAIKALSK